MARETNGGAVGIERDRRSNHRAALRSSAATDATKSKASQGKDSTSIVHSFPAACFNAFRAFAPSRPVALMKRTMPANRGFASAHAHHASGDLNRKTALMIRVTSGQTKAH